MVIAPPRIAHVPAADDQALGARAVAFARRIGMTLDPEQELVLEGACGTRSDGKWQAREVGVNMPRQNGKGEILIARELAGIFEFGERLVIHTAHEFKTSAEHFQRLEDVVRSCPELHDQVKRSASGRITGYRYSHGEESITFQSGARIEFKTRTKSGMRGFAGVDLLVIDEAMIISESQHSSAMPIIRASSTEHGPQLWYTGSAVDQETHDHGVVWTRVRERGLAGEDPELAYYEWSLDVEHPNDVSDEQILDTDLWRQIHIAVARGRVSVEHMEWERRAMSTRGFCVELLGVGDYPATEVGADSLVDLETWRARENPESVLVDPICLIFDVSPDRRSSVVAAGRNDRGKFHVELIHANTGTGWLAGRIAELAKRHQVTEIACDGYGPSAAVARRIEDEAGTKVRRFDAAEYSIACGAFVDAVSEGGLEHLGQEELERAIRGAKARPLVDRWAWSRTKSSVDISPLVAATLALYSAVENDVGTLAIY